jgi:hypothetical protein
MVMMSGASTPVAVERAFRRLQSPARHRLKRAILVSAFCLLGCAEHRDSANLVNGYKLLAMNPTELYVAKSANELIVGPTIETIGVSGDLIVANCGLEKRTVNGFENTTGYNIIDTRSGLVTKRLTEEGMRTQLGRLNKEVPKMQSPSSLLK